MTASAVVYGRRINGRLLTFTLSPRLYRNNLLLVDVETRSLWSQLKSQAVGGSLNGTAWPMLPSMQTSWKHWKTRHPGTFLVDTAGSLGRPYGYHLEKRRSPRDGQHPRRGQPAAISDGIPRPRELVLGVAMGSAAKAFPFSELAAALLPVREIIGTQTVLVHFDKRIPAAWATDGKGKLLPSVTSYWFGWSSFHRDSKIFHADRSPATGAPSVR